jgi:hypothetical protein
MAARGNRVQGQSTTGFSVKFVGMMGFVRRSDGSLLVALPGDHHLGQSSHVPFLMARSGSTVAAALGLTPMPGVVAGAFDQELANAPADGFVFRCLDGSDIEIVSSGGVVVANEASQMAQMHRIAPGKRVRGDIRRWSQSTVTLLGGVLRNAAAHPDAGRVWSFGSYQQPLTDAVRYDVSAATVRLSSGAAVRTFAAGAADPAELWVVSAAGPRTEAGDPKRLDHASVLFNYFAAAEPITPYCPEAEGRVTFATELPCSASLASSRGGAAMAAPPFVELCFNGYYEDEL